MADVVREGTEKERERLKESSRLVVNGVRVINFSDFRPNLLFFSLLCSLACVKMRIRKKPLVPLPFVPSSSSLPFSAATDDDGSPREEQRRINRGERNLEKGDLDVHHPDNDPWKVQVLQGEKVGNGGNRRGSESIRSGGAKGSDVSGPLCFHRRVVMVRALGAVALTGEGGGVSKGRQGATPCASTTEPGTRRGGHHDPDPKRAPPSQGLGPLTLPCSVCSLDATATTAPIITTTDHQ
ncbi:hypothetical protein H6P81_004321 [Aristolochia fimbriata]|uniref:Uncharacterized protein n=1 Tax=Aristolochia fimbriata TaxID=158543 RepID=A0AAV7FHY5_ARIFI|nr:hypothetical protein H6P81_004321 [Aristolochia fimbriata]